MSAVVRLPNNGWRPRNYQLPFWNEWVVNGKDRAIEIAHRRWGKDDIVLHGTAIKTQERVGNYWHCMPLYTQARIALWNGINGHTGKRRIDEAFPEDLRASTNDNDMMIKFKNGSTWQLIGSDNYNKLVGAGTVGISFSEWALCNPSAWAYFRPMVEENQGWATFITTPRGRNHAKRMFDIGRQSARWFAEVSSVDQTGALTKEQLDEALDEYTAIHGLDMGLALLQQEYFCSFNAAIPGAYYAREMLAVRNEERITSECIAVPNYPVHTVWDLGVSKGALVIWFFQVVGQQIYILDVMATGDLGIDNAKDEIFKRREIYGWKAGVDFVPPDARARELGAPGARTRVETMRAEGLRPEIVPMQTVDDGRNAVRQTLPFCVFHPRCEEKGIAGLEAYHREWDDEKKTFKNTHVNDWSAHIADAFRYLSLSWKSVDKAHKIIKQPQPSGTVILPGAPKPMSSKRIKL